MALRMGMAGYVLLLVAGEALLHRAAAQKTHVVGDSMGWVIPPGGAAAYTTWASSKKFMVCDTLMFNFTTGDQDVAQVSKTAFEACSATNTIGSVITTGPANVTLVSEGDYYYICTFSQHCTIGQKLRITVQASPSASPMEGPFSSTPPSSPTPTSAILFVPNIPPLAAMRPFEGELWLKEIAPVLQSLQKGPVPPSTTSPCTYIPGGAILFVPNFLQLAAMRPLEEEQWLKEIALVLESLQKAPVPPSASSSCTNIPGGSGNCK
ncbi:hypothetical protein HHK36_032898 [Tetracentron sinense]|uniref:Phytocyanin domain-containing protein n=1 Tax=Tetracentron sinense TaxID=13715 RepID=A0A834Y4S3_TETSI|nr:hypothetical protein HHK36_032898 [Tetracentron sinense]